MRFLLIIILFLISSCGIIWKMPDLEKDQSDKDIKNRASHIFNKIFHIDSAYIKEDERLKQFDPIQKKLLLITKSDFAKEIITYDLLNLLDNQTQFKHCPISDLGMLLEKYDITLDDYKKLIKDIDKKLNNLTRENAKIHDFLQERVASKITYLTNILESIKIKDENIRLIESKNYARESANYYELYKKQENAYKKNDLPGLEMQIRRLARIGDIVKNMPIMNPMIEGKIIRHFGKKFNQLSEKEILNDGMDFRGETRSIIVSSANGRVKLAGPYEDLGYSIIIDHGNGVESVYSYLEYPLLVKINDEVKVNQPIAYQGNSGDNAARRFHYQIRVNGRSIDPRIFMGLSNKCHYGTNVKSLY